MTRRALSNRTFDATPDVIDFRDRMFVPTLTEVPIEIPLGDYKALGVPILDQGTEGACTGFGLATVVHYLLRTRRVVPDDGPVSPRMLYEMAKRYDEWPGEGYEGSSARGAMKGWHKHGICGEAVWPYRPGDRSARLSPERWQDAAGRPLGAYFRVNHRDLVAMHTAMAEVGVLYVTGLVHDGWGEVSPDGVIPFRRRRRGGHAFSIVGYTKEGFWIQNSWGEDWGFGGYALITYDDWLSNGTDVWVARMGVPLQVSGSTSVATSLSSAGNKEGASYYHQLRAHVISIGNDGLLRTSGTYGTSIEDVREIFEEDIPRITDRWRKKRLVLYAHGGLVPEDAAIQRVAAIRDACFENRIYPLSLVWKSDFWSTLGNILEDAQRGRRSEGILDSAKDFLLDRLDDALEPIARVAGGRALWKEMKENALGATEREDGGARLTLIHLAELAQVDKAVEVHLVGHSAGSIFHAPVVRFLGELGVPIQTCTLWAPACTLELFEEAYLPAIESRAIREFSLYTLTDQAEQDDHCANLYHRSLLYLVSNAFERTARIPFLTGDGVPLLGMDKFVSARPRLKKVLQTKRTDWVRAPNEVPSRQRGASRATSHGGFDDDPATLQSTLARIIGSAEVRGNVDQIRSTAAGLKNRRRSLR